MNSSLRERATLALFSTPPTTRALVLLVFVLSILRLVVGRFGYGEYLTVTPYNSIPCIWTFVTAGWIETGFYSFLVNIVVLTFAGRYFEQAWGQREYTKFILIVPTISYFLTFFMQFIEYAINMNTTYLVDQANGLGALLTGFLIAFKQIIPEHSLKVASGAISVRVKHLPSLLLITTTFLFIIRVIHTQFFIILAGAATSWVYLRFYRVQEGIRGDRSEAFAFLSFWPEGLHPILKPISNSLYAIFVKLRIVPNSGDGALPTHSRSGAGGGGAGQGAGAAGLTTEISDAERRRALALKALNQHLSQASATPATSSATATPNQS
ncbi:hypothetical protein HK097_001133 [Rhizophlyctis rosea]|uniref:EOG090X06Q3 n=1 Tax=Rhizophlyctis rosea TaxID=64517 RepID=A0AAD5X254_9FUNG|nr:hypothetical protein HK097_001133 [Rhizophlyctis rosea]